MGRYIVDGILKFSFYVRIKDVEGKSIPLRNPETGQQKYISGKPQYIDERIQFETTPVDPKKPLVRSCFFVVEDQNQTIMRIAEKHSLPVSHITKLVDDTLSELDKRDQSGGVMNVEKYDERRNPAAFKERAERKRIEKELAEAKSFAASKETELENAKEKVNEAEAAKTVAENLSAEKDRKLAEMQAQMDELMSHKRGPKPKEKSDTLTT